LSVGEDKNRSKRELNERRKKIRQRRGVRKGTRRAGARVQIYVATISNPWPKEMAERWEGKKREVQHRVRGGYERATEKKALGMGH
jgi:hypothetical protein